MKIHQLEVNIEVNGQYRNEITLSMTWISKQLIRTTTKQEEDNVNDSKSYSSPPWNSLGAKHKSAKDKSDMWWRLTGKTQYPETGWPPLPSYRSVSSTLLLRRKHPATTKRKSKLTQDTQGSDLHAKLENRFPALLQDSDSLKESSAPSSQLQRTRPNHTVKASRKSSLLDLKCW